MISLLVLVTGFSMSVTKTMTCGAMTCANCNEPSYVRVKNQFITAHVANPSHHSSEVRCDCRGILR